jgi:hypothetical protein
MIDQVAIAVLGTVAIWLSQDPRPWKQRWACVFGLGAQPFWIYAAWQAAQWGILALAVVYTAAWGRGAWHFWIAPNNRRKS